MTGQNYPKKPRGPEPERVKIDEKWEKAVGKALAKPRPAKGWPTAPEKKPKGD